MYISIKPVFLVKDFILKTYNFTLLIVSEYNSFEIF